MAAFTSIGLASSSSSSKASEAKPEIGHRIPVAGECESSLGIGVECRLAINGRDHVIQGRVVALDAV
jgi:hypothetical protein